ncbi:OmpA family protein [Spongiimicrobium salis]|uniref:OmpA family protein n=1 Tax=Spongiimicrobium salis TaxID=1667022 RepID=UPI00374D4A08
MKTTITTLFLLVFLLTFSQENQNSADKSFNNLSYIKAAEQYERMVRNGDDSKEVLQHLGDSYYFNTDMKNAVKWYGQLFSKYEHVLEPKYLFRYIHALKGVGNYRLAKGLMKIYKHDTGASNFSVAQLKDNDKKLDALLKQQPQFYITHLSINTPMADFGSTFYEDKIIFASSRDSLNLHTRLYEWNRQPFLNLFSADTLDIGSDLVEVHSFSKIINTKYHEASVSFTPDQKTMYFTRNNYTDKNLERDQEGTNHLKIYRTFLKDGTWSSPQEIAINNVAYSVGQPALSPDGKKLYFVSDMPGSIGATDIFVAEILEDGTFSQPKNLGLGINTSGREMFPYITAGKLYFASDGHLGLGGLDIFESTINNGFSKPVNLGKLLNSSKDDFGYIVNENTGRGYFSSNREGGTGDDDIYSFQRLDKECHQTVEGIVTRTSNAQPLDDVSVQLLDSTGVILEETTTGMEGIFRFDTLLSCLTSYQIQVSKTGYHETLQDFTTTNEIGFDNTIPLKITRILEEWSTVEQGVRKIKIDHIFFDLNKAEIKFEAAMELNKIVTIMKEYPKMIIKIESHTDARGSDNYNEALSDKRAKSTAEYIISQGIESHRIKSAIGYGEKKLLNGCSNNVQCSDRAHNINRRSEFIILNLD